MFHLKPTPLFLSKKNIYYLLFNLLEIIVSQSCSSFSVFVIKKTFYLFFFLWMKFSLLANLISHFNKIVAGDALFDFLVKINNLLFQWFLKRGTQKLGKSEKNWWRINFFQIFYKFKICWINFEKDKNSHNS